MRRALLIATLLAALLSAAVAVADTAPRARSAVSVGPFRGTAVADLDRFHYMTNGRSGNERFESFSKDRYQARFTYSFRITSTGAVEGRGDGVYTSATWRLEGQNQDEGSFGCDVPVRTEPFTVRVSGFADNGRVQLRFDLENARESNQEQDCGADYKALATNSTYLSNSLDHVQSKQPDGQITVNQSRPSIGRLSDLETTGPDDNRRVILHEWTFTIEAPPGPVNPRGGPSPGSSTFPGGPGSAICTIEGTAGNNRLTGTSGNDVICGYGGNDRINARGGDDLVFGGPGNDSITGGANEDWLSGDRGNDSFRARDRRRDTLRGGPGRDRALYDRGRDSLGSVERR